MPQRPPGAKPFRRKGLHGSQEVPSSAFLPQGSHQHLTTSTVYWEQQKSSQISVRKICICCTYTTHILEWKGMSAWINGGIRKPPQTLWNSRTKCMRHQLLCLSVTHKALVKSKRLFPPVSRCKGTKLINFLVITAQHWRGREAVRQMPLGATLTFNCKPREESQCPRSLGLETGSV